MTNLTAPAGARPGDDFSEERAMADQPVTTFEIHSEARGPHWVAWLAQPGQPGPYRALLHVGASKEEAEGRARDWAAAVAGQADGSSRSS